MQIALSHFAGFLSPLQSLAHRWMSARNARPAMSSGLRYVGVRPSCGLRQAESTAGSQGDGASQAEGGSLRLSRPLRPLRVVRRVEALQPGRHPSRMVISGRLADVCAELDRLAALEAAETRALAEVEAMAAMVGRSLRADKLH